MKKKATKKVLENDTLSADQATPALEKVSKNDTGPVYVMNTGKHRVHTGSGALKAGEIGEVTRAQCDALVKAGLVDVVEHSD